MNKEIKLNELDLMKIQDEFKKGGIDFNIDEYREEGMKLNELDLMEIQDEFEKSGIHFDINEYREEEDAEVAADLVKYDITIEEYDEVSRLLDLYEEGTDINDILKGMSKGQQECFYDYARALNTIWEEDY